MSDHRHIRSLGVERPGEAYFFGYEEGPPGDGQVRLETLYTGLSAGTELTFYKGTNPYLHSRWDGERGVFIPNEAGMHYPVPFMGYMEVARVVESRSPAFRTGQVVATTYAHKSGHTANPFHDLLIPLPTTWIPSSGSTWPRWARSRRTASCMPMPRSSAPTSRRSASGSRGRPVLVIGGGVVGLLTALFAQQSGATEVLVADPSRFRRERAEALGLEAVTEDQAWSLAKERWHHGGSDRGADFVFQTRAHPESLQAALRALRPQGTVIDLAFYQGGAEAVRLGEGVPSQRSRDPLRPDRAGAARPRVRLGPPPSGARDRSASRRGRRRPDRERDHACGPVRRRARVPEDAARDAAGVSCRSCSRAPTDVGHGCGPGSHPLGLRVAGRGR